MNSSDFNDFADDYKIQYSLEKNIFRTIFKFYFTETIQMVVKV